MLKSIAALSLVLASFSGFTQAAVSDEKSCIERPLTAVRSIRVNDGTVPGSIDTCKQGNVVRGKAGLMTDYPIYEATPRDPREQLS